MRRFADSMTWAEDKGFAISEALDARVGFVRRTYAHLLAELVGVTLVVYLGLQSEAVTRLAFSLMSRWYIYVLAFFGVSLVTRKMLEGRRSLGIQYAAAGIWVCFLGLLLIPLAVIAWAQTGSYVVLGEAAVLTGSVFAGLTAYVFFTKKDFSVIRGALWALTWLAFGVGIVFAIFGGMSASGSLVFSVIWVVLLAGWVLYDTSNILHHRHVDQYVAASVDLLVDFVYMFIHIAWLLLGSRR